MSPTSGIYWVELGFINNYKEPQLRLVLLRYSADVASAFPWVVTIGDENLIDVWRHRWLPDLNHSKIISPRTDSSIHRVCDLYFLDIRVWDPGRLESCLIPRVADLVRRIQVCEDGAEDTLIWPLTSDGNYSVRSAYRMLVSAKFILQPSSSVSGSIGLVWKKIWKMRVPNKIRHFI